MTAPTIMAMPFFVCDTTGKAVLGAWETAKAEVLSEIMLHGHKYTIHATKDANIEDGEIYWFGTTDDAVAAITFNDILAAYQHRQ